MHDGGLVHAVLNLTGLNVGDGLGHVHGHGAGLGVGHQALGAEHTTDAADQTHHVGGGDADVEVEPVLALDLGDQLLSADVIRTRLLGDAGIVALGKDQHADGLTGTMGQHDGAADLLVGVAGIDAQADGDLQGLVELRLGGLQRQRDGLFGLVVVLLDQLDAVLIFLTMLHGSLPPVS